LPSLLALENSDLWILTDDKQAILALALETASLLVSPINPDCFANQTTIGKDSTFASILKLALAGVNSPAVRTKALWALGDVTRGHPGNRTTLEGTLQSRTVVGRKLTNPSCQIQRRFERSSPITHQIGPNHAQLENTEGTEGCTSRLPMLSLRERRGPTSLSDNSRPNSQRGRVTWSITLPQHRQLGGASWGSPAKLVRRSGALIRHLRQPYGQRHHLANSIGSSCRGWCAILINALW